MLKLFKKLQILLFILFFGSLGFLYNFTTEDEWFVRYKLKQSFTSKIYLRSIDERIKALKVSDATHRKFLESMGPIIAERQFSLRKEFPSVSELRVSETQLSMVIKDYKNANKIAEEIVKKLNDMIKRDVSSRVNVYIDQALLLLEEEKTMRVQDLKRKIAFYADKKVTPLSLSPSASLTIDSYILNKEDEQAAEIMKDLKKELIQYEFYNAVNRFELDLLTLNQTDVSENINISILFSTIDNINKENYLTIRGKDKLFNRKPNLKNTVIAFAGFGFFLSLIFIFLFLNLGILKKLKLKKLLTLQYLK